MKLRSFGTTVIAVAAALFFAAPQASALEIRAFDQDAFEAAQAAGAPIVVDIHADWCSTCAAQRRVLNSLAADPRFADLIVFDVDYDMERHIMRMFAVATRSTFIGFNGSTEVDRLYSVTSTAGIEAFLLTLID